MPRRAAHNSEAPTGAFTIGARPHRNDQKPIVGGGAKVNRVLQPANLAHRRCIAEVNSHVYHGAATAKFQHIV